MPSFRNYDDNARTQPYGWVWEIPQPNGAKPKREREKFHTKAQKKEFLDKYTRNWYSRRDLFLNFDDALYFEWMANAEVLKSRGQTFQELIEQADSSPMKKDVITITDTFNLEYDDLKKADYINIKQFSLHRDQFIDFVGDPDLPIDQLENKQVQDWIYHLEDERKLLPATVNNYITHIRMGITRLVHLNQLSYSPAKVLKIKKDKVKKVPKIMDVQNVIKLLRWCERNDPGLAGLLGLMYFGGIRVSIISPETKKKHRDGQFSLDMIDYEKMKIDLPGELMKSNQFVANQTILDDTFDHGWSGLPPNIWGWLKLLDPNDMELTKEQFNTRRKRACYSSGVTWERNVARHTFATAYAIYKRSSHQAGEVMGTRSPEIFQTHYKGLMEYEDAKSYFSIEAEQI